MDHQSALEVHLYFNEYTTKRNNKGLTSNGFNYSAQTKGNPVYLMWRCSKSKETHCGSYFYTDVETHFYSGFNNFHTCTGSRDELKII